MNSSALVFFVSKEKGLPHELGEEINEFLRGQLAAEAMVPCRACGTLFRPEGRYFALFVAPSLPEVFREEVCSFRCIFGWGKKNKKTF